MTNDYQAYLDIVRYSLDSGGEIPESLANIDWNGLYRFANRQAVIGIVFDAVIRLRESGMKPPYDLLMSWIAASEQIGGQNQRLDRECRRLTRLFESEGHRTVILKGQANARLYPNPLRRQSGDIDIYVDGGEDAVMQTLLRLGLIPNMTIGEFEGEGNVLKSYHHVHLPANDEVVEVEVHFRPGSGVINPSYNQRIQAFLTKEVFEGAQMTDAGFAVPSVRFALVMQLAHIQKHLVSAGIGLRQLIDYYYLLQHYEKDKETDMAREMEYLGLKNVAGAVMWVLKEILGIEEKYLIAPADERRGRMLLREIIKGGNFGKYSVEKNQRPVGRLLLGRLRHLRLMPFDFKEIAWSEVDYVKLQARKTAWRMKRFLLFFLMSLVTTVHAQQKHSDTIDDIMQYTPYASVFALKAFGVPSRDDAGKMAVATVATWVSTAGAGWVLKHSVKETRPDGSDRKSFPSGHSIVAFSGATALHKEFGKVSPWISIAGYGVATFVAVDRIANDRHHWYDVVAGAGIGIAGAEICWWLSDKLLGSGSNVAVGTSGNTVDVTVRW